MIYVQLGDTEAPLLRVLDDVAVTLCEADDASWAAASLEERDRYRRLADSMLRRHAVFDPATRGQF